MIRFACPGCAAAYAVEDAKAGKTGKCPKCHAHFVIPSADPAPTDPPADPDVAGGPTATTESAPAPPSGPVEIDPCPGCRTRLSVEVSDLGVNVECPYCMAVYPAVRAGAAPSRPRRAPVVDPETLAAEERQSRRRRDRDEEGDDRPSRRRRRDDDYEDDDRPRRSRRRRRYDGIESKRVTAGILAILLGIFGVHKFYLGYTSSGLVMLLLLCLAPAGKIIAVIEGIIYLTMSDEDFIETYQIGEKPWF